MAKIMNNKASLQKVRKFAKSIGGESSTRKNKKGKKVLVIASKDDDVDEKEVPLENIDAVLDSLENDTDNKI